MIYRVNIQNENFKETKHINAPSLKAVAKHAKKYFSEKYGVSEADITVSLADPKDHIKEIFEFIYNG